MGKLASTTPFLRLTLISLITLKKSLIEWSSNALPTGSYKPATRQMAKWWLSHRKRRNRKDLSPSSTADFFSFSFLFIYFRIWDFSSSFLLLKVWDLGFDRRIKGTSLGEGLVGAIHGWCHIITHHDPTIMIRKLQMDKKKERKEEEKSNFDSRR